MSSVRVEEENTLHKVLVEHGGVLHLEQMKEAELRKVPHLWVNESTHDMEEQRTFPLDVVLLQETCQQCQSLPPDEQGTVPEGRGDGW